MRPVGANDKAVPDLPSASLPIADADLLLVIQGGVAEKATRGQVIRALPSHICLMHGGITGINIATAPASTAIAASPGAEFTSTNMLTRTVFDMSNVTQAKLVTSVRTAFAGATTYNLRMMYATNGATQTTWAELAATTGGGDLSVLAGSVGLVRSTGWFNIAAGAKVDPAFIRCNYISAVVATAGVVNYVDLLLR